MMTDMTATSGLIQMTAHSLTSSAARGWIIAGALIAALGAFLVLCVAAGQRERRVRYIIVFAMVAAVGILMLVHGARLPRVKEIKACASGPISLEEVAARYDIIEVDGKLLILRER